jgi:hypothetical protein
MHVCLDRVLTYLPRDCRGARRRQRWYWYEQKERGGVAGNREAPLCCDARDWWVWGEL